MHNLWVAVVSLWVPLYQTQVLVVTGGIQTWNLCTCTMKCATSSICSHEIHNLNNGMIQMCLSKAQCLRILLGSTSDGNTFTKNISCQCRCVNDLGRRVRGNLSRRLIPPKERGCPVLVLLIHVPGNTNKNTDTVAASSSTSTNG